MSKIEVELVPTFQSTKMTIELADLGFTEKTWNDTKESVKERILDEYISVYYPELSPWSFREWTPKY